MADTMDPRTDLTFKEVWAAIMALRESQQEIARQIKESQAETARQMKESQQETDRKLQETARQMKETDRQIKETSRELGKLGNRFGELAEHLVAPSIREKFNALGYHFEEIIQDYQMGKFAEVDILLENDNFSVAIEVKSKPRPEDVDEHLERLEIIRQFKDRHGDRRKVRGALAGAIMPESVRNYAIKKGLYVIVQT
ncbi:MAG: hypothetical protein LBQ61_01965, partial [Spirochaetales bacterium]|nr:hypothetical protein [Spirochaetales bacterium]